VFQATTAMAFGHGRFVVPVGSNVDLATASERDCECGAPVATGTPCRKRLLALGRAGGSPEGSRHRLAERARSGLPGPSRKARIPVLPVVIVIGGPMNTPSSLDSKTLARRLGEFAGDERQVQVEFLLHLDVFDRRRAFLDLGFGSLWTCCLEALHLREGSAGQRIAAMRILRRFPGLAEALRDGRLCLSTLAMLGPVLTEENLDGVVARAAFRTAAEVDHLVASMRPRPAPREGIRRIADGADRQAPPELPGVSPSLPEGPRELAGEESIVSPEEARPAPGVEMPSPPKGERERVREPSARAEVRAVSEGQWSLRVTVDKSLKDDLEALAALLSHKLPRGDLAAVLREAVRCGIEKNGKRKGAVKPERRPAPRAAAPKNLAAIPAELRRQVWDRDGGRCAPDGRRCGSRWQVEVDHVDPVGRGGMATLVGLRLLCKGHNLLHAEQVYGREHMRKYRKGERTIDVESARRRGAAMARPAG
jgi:hypothetical protein